MKKDQRLVQSEKAIFDAAMKTLIVDPSAGMSEIAISAGVGRATLYRHFETKEVLVRALVLECTKETERALEGIEKLGARAAIEAIFERLMPLSDRYQFLTKIWRLIEDDQELTQIEESWADDLFDLMDSAKKQGELNDILPTEWLVAFFDSTFEAAWSLVSSEKLSAKDAAKFAKYSFFGGCSV